MVRGVGDVDGDGYADMLVISNRNWQGSGSYLLRSPVRSELSRSPSQTPTNFPTIAPSSSIPSIEPSVLPTEVPSELPSIAPSGPTAAPSVQPTAPTLFPSKSPTQRPSQPPSLLPTRTPTERPVQRFGTFSPTIKRTSTPSLSLSPSRRPALAPSRAPVGPSMPVSTSRPSILPPDDDNHHNPAVNITYIKRGGIVQDPPSIINPSSSRGTVEKRVYVVDSPTDVMIQRSLPPAFSPSSSSSFLTAFSSSVVSSGGSYRVYVIKPRKQMKTTIQPFLSSNDVLDLSAYTSYGIYSFEALSFSRSGAGGGRGSSGVGGGGILNVILPHGQQIILPSILSLPSIPSTGASSSLDDIGLTSDNFMFGDRPVPHQQEVADSSVGYYFSSLFWDGGLLWAISLLIVLCLLVMSCVCLEWEEQEKQQKEIDRIFYHEPLSPSVVSHDEENPPAPLSSFALPTHSLVLVVSRGSSSSSSPCSSDEEEDEVDGSDEDEDDDGEEEDEEQEDADDSDSFESESFHSFGEETPRISDYFSNHSEASLSSSASLKASSSSSSSSSSLSSVETSRSQSFASRR